MGKEGGMGKEGEGEGGGRRGRVRAKRDTEKYIE